MSLFQKLLLLLVVAMFIPVVLLGYLSYNRSKMQIEDVTSVFLQDNLSHNEDKLDGFFNDLDAMSFKVIASPKIQALLKSTPPQSFFEEAEFISAMKGITEDLKGTYNLTILPNHSEKYPNYMNSNSVLGVDQDAMLIAKAFEKGGKPYWVHEIDPSLLSPDLIYVRAIRTLGDFKDAGVMVIRISKNLLRSQLILPSQYPNFLLTLVEGQQKVLTSNPAFTDLDRHGSKYYQASKAIASNEKWQLTATIPVSDLTGHINDIKFFTVWIVAGGLIFILILLFIIVGRFTAPIQLVVRHMKKVQLGRLVHFPKFAEQKDEIGQLVRGYNSMIDGMEQLLDRTKSMESEKQKLQLRMLINQINPHFLYNTLDSIKWKAEFAQEKTISEMVTTLADMLRFSIHDEDEWTTIERELEHARNYLNIELLRNNNSFQVMFNVQPSILHLKLLKLVVQPLMENAVRHGMNKLTNRKGKIMLTAYLEDNQIIIIVEDNGQGCEEQQLGSYKEPSYTPGVNGGIGLYNVHRRLQLHYGIAYGIMTENIVPNGFRVTLRHPLVETML